MPTAEREVGADGSGASRRWIWAGLAAVLLAGLGLRLWGVRQGLPYAYNSDEADHFVVHAITMFEQGTLNPHYFANPPAFTYLLHGLFALYYPQLLPLYQLRVYIDTPDEVCFEPRLKRDVQERGRTPESVRRQYEATVRPASQAFVRPSAVNADLTVDGTGALDWKVERVVTEIRARGLLHGPK